MKTIQLDEAMRKKKHLETMYLTRRMFLIILSTSKPEKSIIT